MNIHEFCDWLDKELNHICIMPQKCVAYEEQIPCVEVTTPFLDTFNDTIQLYVAQRNYQADIDAEPTYRSDFITPEDSSKKNGVDMFVIFDDGFFSSTYTGKCVYLETTDIHLTESGILEYESSCVYEIPRKILIFAADIAGTARLHDKRFPIAMECWRNQRKSL